MKIIAVFGASRCEPGDPLWEQGSSCGNLLAQAGCAVVTGGYGGVMEAVSRGAREAGGHVIGVTAPAVFPDRDGANVFVTEERRANSLSERVHELMDIADGAIALHGSIGTLTELMMAWNLAFVSRFSGRHPIPIVAVGPRWRSVVTDLTNLLETDGSLVHCVDTVDEAAAIVSA